MNPGFPELPPGSKLGQVGIAAGKDDHNAQARELIAAQQSGDTRCA